jgi:antirestriction protein ArdC
MVVFWTQYETTDRETSEPTTVPVLRYYNVFNAEQCDGLDVIDAQTGPEPFEPVAEAERIVAGYAGGPRIEHGGSQAFYRPAEDLVRLPEPARFLSREFYYATEFHELAHSTGHTSRLDRGLDKILPAFGSPDDYSREELVAEMSSAFLCAAAGISPPTIEQGRRLHRRLAKTADGRQEAGGRGCGRRPARRRLDPGPAGAAGGSRGAGRAGSPLKYAAGRYA